MAATPPRPASPAQRPAVVIPKPGHNLQISPNLEALLRHDELTRRSNSSPTSTHYHASPSTSGFPFSLPPPPPRQTRTGRKVGGQQHEQLEPFPTTRSKEAQRSKGVLVGHDVQWPRTLGDGGDGRRSTSGPSSRPVSPNPYINPTPILRPINTDIDPPSLKQVDESPQNETKPDPSRSGPETRGRASTSDPHRPSTALHKVEKILWIGRDSLSLFSGSAHNLRRDSDRRNDHLESSDLDAVQALDRQEKQMRQVTVTTPLSLPRPPSRFGDSDTATVTLSSKSATSHPHVLQQGPHCEPSETASYPAGHTRDPTPTPPPRSQPHLSLPSTSMSQKSSRRPKSVDTVTGNDYLSFIDFFSPSTPDEPTICNIHDDPQELCSSRPRLPSISIPPSSIYSLSHLSHSAISLASMRFAPPSPTSLTVHQPSPVYPGSGTSSSSIALPNMVFAPPSPSAERIPTRLQPLSDPPSPFSPLEFALPPTARPEGADNSLQITPGASSERSRKLKPKKRSKSSSPYHAHPASSSPLPPTTNELGANERADRIRRNRKLARVFGRAPGAEEPITDTDEQRVYKKSHPPSLAALLTKPKSHRHAVSVSVSVKASGMKTEPSTPWQTENLWSPDGRRHSTPLATDFTLYVDDEQRRIDPRDPVRSRKLMDSPEAASTRSFIDLSDEETRDDVSDLNLFAPHHARLRRLHHSNSTPSLVESLDLEAQAEAERRQKREKMARLHRFLGSRVPPEAVCASVFGPPLPPLAPREGLDHERRLRGKKHASSDDFDRGKEELDEREKALNVRRAQKMERVFGTPPPQVLFYPRPCRPTAPLSQPASPTDTNPYVLTLNLPSSSRNPNQSAYTGKTPHRPGPSDSSRCLLSRSEDATQSSPSSFAQSFADSFTGSLSGYQQILAQSSVYLNYQHSLNSLIDIIDRDDRRSLFELHHFLHSEADDSASEEEVVANPRRFSNASSLRSERRHSLPSNASMTSLSSELYVSPRVSRFQIRRRKAAKLTNFFGVDYRELIHDILESIEKGVEEDHKKGTLQPEEAEVLMHRVRSLRSLRDPFPSL